MAQNREDSRRHQQDPRHRHAPSGLRHPPVCLETFSGGKEGEEGKIVDRRNEYKSKHNSRYLKDTSSLCHLVRCHAGKRGRASQTIVIVYSQAHYS